MEETKRKRQEKMFKGKRGKAIKNMKKIKLPSPAQQTF